MRKAFLLLICSAFFALILPAQITVWPGDANNNGEANHIDLLYIGTGYNSSGAARTSVSIAWQGFSLGTLWADSLSNGANYGHLDCDGNGQVGFSDVQAIEQNYRQRHGFIFIPDTFSQGTPIDPYLILDFRLDSLATGATGYFDVSLGNPAQPIDSLYGLAFTIEYDTSLVDSIWWDTDPSSWLSSGGGMTGLSITKWHPLEGKLDVAITRTNQTNGSGFGRIGGIGIVMDDNLKTNMNAEMLHLDFTGLLALSATESIINMHGGGDSLLIYTGLQESVVENGQVLIFPNPVRTELFVEIEAGLKGRLGDLKGYEVYDISGRRVEAGLLNGSKARIEVANWLPGIYFLRIRMKNGTKTEKVMVLPK